MYQKFAKCKWSNKEVLQLCNYAYRRAKSLQIIFAVKGQVLRAVNLQNLPAQNRPNSNALFVTKRFWAAASFIARVIAFEFDVGSITIYELSF